MTEKELEKEIIDTAHLNYVMEDQIEAFIWGAKWMQVVMNEIQEQEIIDAVAHGNTYKSYCDYIDEHAKSYFKHFFLTNKPK